MKEIEISSTITELDFESELSDQQKQLILSAQEATEIAYAKYSNYKVGAALLLDDGTIIKGNNQENAVYPLGLCAERVAIFNATSNYPDRRPVALAISIASDKKPGFPCGSCRQSMREVETRYNSDLEILIESSEGKVLKVKSVKDILPFSFDANSL